MSWERSPLADVIAWCDACAKGFDPSTGAPVPAPQGTLGMALPVPTPCPTCGAPLAMKRAVSEMASRATMIDARRPAGTSRATLVDSPQGAAVAGTHPAPRVEPRATDLGAVEYPRIGPFQIVRELGRGGMGVVYLAEDPSLGRQCAVKVLPLTGEAANDPEWVERFEREARATAQLNHPNLVAVHTVGQTPACRYIAMDFVAGRPLDELFRLEGMSPERAIRIVWQTALGLAHAHAQGVVHRDIKPSNILVEQALFSGSEMRLARRERSALEAAARLHGKKLTARAAARPDGDDGDPPSGKLVEDVARITDFGLAVSTRSHRLTVEGAILGTPTYMSPEQTLGKSGDATPQMDIYSLGATLYELLTGAPPFTAPETATLFFQIQDTEPIPPRKINPRLDRDIETVVLKCLDKDPAKRYADARDLAEDLRRWLDDEPVQARRPSRIDAWKRRFRRSPMSWVTGTALALVLVALAGYGIADTTLRHLRFEETMAAAESALAAGDFGAARDRLQQAAGFLPKRSEIALLSHHVDRKQAIAKTLGLGKQRLEEWKQARSDARRHEEERARREGALTEGAGIAARQAVWESEAAATDAVARARATREGASSNLAAVLETDPAHEEARKLLRELAWTLFHEAESAGDTAEQERWKARLDELSAAGHELLLEMPSQIRLESDAAGARVSAWRYVEAGKLMLPRPAGESPLDAERTAAAIRRFEADPAGETLPPLEQRGVESAFVGAHSRPAEIGSTPIDAKQQPGCYLFLIEKDGHDPVRVPVRLARAAKALALTLTLPKAGTVPAGFVHVPAGPFLRGEPRVEARTEEFCIARFEVTNGEYLTYVNDPETLAEVTPPDGGIVRVPRTAPREGALWPQDVQGKFSLPEGTRADAPVTGIDLHDARSYAAWYERRHANETWVFSLPTEEEWEKAMRGGDGREYPWGNAFDAALCAIKGSVKGGPAPVGAFPADESPYGARDMAGNAAEWTEGGDEQGGYAVKGGSWASEPRWCKADSRDLDKPAEIDDENGFRLVARRRR